MARFQLTIIVDDDEIESMADIDYMFDKAWADENTNHHLAFEGKRPGGGAVSFVADADRSSFGCKLLRDTPKPKEVTA